jgi:hypothetical protein
VLLGKKLLLDRHVEIVNVPRQSVWRIALSRRFGDLS